MARPVKGIEFTMIPDTGVQPSKLPPERKTRTFDPRIQEYVEQFAAFKVGQSFFVEGASRRDLEFVRRPFMAVGLGVVMREVECDEIYGSAGVRVWRQHGEYDERPIEGSEHSAYSPHAVTSAAPSVASVPDDYDPDLDGPPPTVVTEDDEL